MSRLWSASKSVQSVNWLLLSAKAWFRALQDMYVLGSLPLTVEVEQGGVFDGAVRNLTRVVARKTLKTLCSHLR